MDLTHRQRRFAAEYIAAGCTNATAAYIRAGYSKAGASVGAAKTLRLAKVQALIAESQREITTRLGVQAEHVVRVYADIALGDPRALMSWGKDGVVLVDSALLTEGQARQVVEIIETPTEHGKSVKIKLADRMRALEVLARYTGVIGREDDSPVPAGGVVVPIQIVVSGHDNV